MYEGRTDRSVLGNNVEGFSSAVLNGGSYFPCKIKKGLRGPVKLPVVDVATHISRFFMQQV